MTKTELNNKLAEACAESTGNLDEIKELILAGADTNQLNQYGDNIFDDVFLYALYDVYDNDGTDEEKQAAYSKVKEIFEIMVDNGFDTARYGLAVSSQFVLSFYDKYVFDIFRFFMKFDLGNNKKQYEKLLEGIGTEESYQRCCEENHELENLFYSIYELVDAKMNGKSCDGIDLYYGARGLKIDKIIYLSDADTTVKKENHTEFLADIGLVCGDKLLVLREGINILFMNDRISEIPQIEMSGLFGTDVIGSTIKDISFAHKKFVKDTTHYGQPIIILELDCGKKLKFSHNFGEFPDKKTQSRFWVE